MQGGSGTGFRSLEIKAGMSMLMVCLPAIMLAFGGQAGRTRAGGEYPDVGNTLFRLLKAFQPGLNDPCIEIQLFHVFPYLIFIPHVCDVIDNGREYFCVYGGSEVWNRCRNPRLKGAYIAGFPHPDE